MAPLALFSVMGLLMLASLCSNAMAEHAWENFHWARTSNPVQVTVVSSMSNKYWDDRLRAVNEDWNRVSAFNGGIKTEYGAWTPKDRQECGFIKGKVRACNANYGENDWAGLASILLNDQGHITACTAQVNDFWMTHEAEKMHVLCQEVGHCWGLGHQSEDGTDLDTCMDYAAARDNRHPDEHDFEMLEAIYTHADHTNTASVSRKLMGVKAPKKAAAAAAVTVSDPSRFGTLIKDDEHELYWEKRLPDGTRVITHALKVGALKKTAAQRTAATKAASTKEAATTEESGDSRVKQVANPLFGSRANAASN